MTKQEIWKRFTALPASGLKRLTLFASLRLNTTVVRGFGRMMIVDQNFVFS